ncbi:MAG TPA: prepilin-type N-terminal cleavage/methylation domain-containing protein [Gemmatimonadaceae bacterium]|nr:prepilin-type N-terminal cleavage/methylation domain-containing protein [Gemmatimonadaceae bacterium]
MPPVPAPRRGFTLMELLVAMILMMIIMTVAVQTFRKSATVLSSQAGALEAQQNGRFSVTSLDRDLRLAGAGVASGQPMIVQASNTAITFNVDLVSRDSTDVSAVYIDPKADSNTTSALRSTNKITLPGSSVTYPDTTYYTASNALSPAETISYYLAKDSTTSRSTEYILWRRVNAATPRVIARGIQFNSTDTVFQYYRETSSGAVSLIPQSSLPLYHSAPVHGSTADTGSYALIDSIRSVHVKLNAVYHDPKNGDVLRPIQATIRLLNAGLDTRTSCGQAPLGVTVSTTTSTGSATSPWVKLTWNPSTDDGGGENDVVRYVIYRRPDSVSAFTAPFTSVPAGASSYTYIDTDVQHGDRWIYGVAAQDCTPSNSAVYTTAMEHIP